VKKFEKITTVIIGKRGNLSRILHDRMPNTKLLSSELLLKSLSELDKYNGQKINVVFNNFQPSTQLKSFDDPCHYLDVSISLTVKILMYLISNDIEINKVIYTSSAAVYGNLATASEDVQTSPSSIPALLKYLNERFLTQICCDHDLNLTITRVFNMYGGNDKFSVIQKIYNCYLNKTVLTVFNEGKSVRDFIHIDNVVDIYEKLLLDLSINIPILNIGSGHGQSVYGILSKLSRSGYTVDTQSIHSKEIMSSKSAITKLQKIIDVSSFVDVTEYLLNKIAETNCQD
jgi:UDP-glucose 4-epimerase